jgi:hypothetical protein
LATLFTSEERSQVRDWMLHVAQQDSRITGGALTGSMANRTEDRWSDIDVAFGVAAGVELDVVLGDLTREVKRRFSPIHHFDLQSGVAIYRVFLLPKGLELDVGLWPASQFGSIGEKFRLVFGHSAENAAAPASATPDHLIELCWHHTLHARAAIERAKPWEAEYYISALRDRSFEIACLRLGLPAIYARGTDKLPYAIKASCEEGLVRSFEANELRRALKSATKAFLHEVAETKPELTESWAKNRGSDHLGGRVGQLWLHNRNTVRTKREVPLLLRYLK